VTRLLTSHDRVADNTIHDIDIMLRLIAVILLLAAAC
jgi:hypothetical protein